MSHEIVCPHCNKAFTVDEAGYAAIVSQVRNSEYQRDLERERRNLEDSLEARISLALAKTEKEYGEKLSQKEEELSSLRTSSLIEKEKLEGSLKALRDSFDSERRNLSLHVIKQPVHLHDLLVTHVRTVLLPKRSFIVNQFCIKWFKLSLFDQFRHQ